MVTMSDADSMSFAASYLLASKVRSKLTKQAANARSSLRTLVLQANMLDNIMNHITLKTEQMKRDEKASFSTSEPVNHKRHSAVETSSGPSVTEYEIDFDSDSDSDLDSVSDLDDAEGIEYTSDGDEDDHYFVSDSEGEDEAVEPMYHMGYAHRNTMSVLDLSDDQQLLIIIEENEDSLPELTQPVSSSDSDSEDDMHIPNYILMSTQTNTSKESLLGAETEMIKHDLCIPHTHQRHDNTLVSVF